MAARTIIDDTGFKSKMKVILDAARRPRAILAAVGQEARNLLIAYFRKKDVEEPNKLGGDRQHFWLNVGRSVQRPEVDEAGGSVSISITDPRFAQKVFGGPIRAKRAKFLAIPLTKEAYGRSPRVFSASTGHPLFFLGNNSGGGLFEHGLSDTGDLIQQYWLTPSVNQQADADALPDLSPNSPFQQALLQRAETVLQRQLNSGAAA